MTSLFNNSNGVYGLKRNEKKLVGLKMNWVSLDFAYLQAHVHMCTLCVRKIS